MTHVCPKCNAEHRAWDGRVACKAHRKRTGEPCRSFPVTGTTVCAKHGGCIPATRRRGAQRAALAKIEKTVGDMLREHDVPDQHPIEALQEIARRSGAMSRSLEQQIAAMRADGEIAPLLMSQYERFTRLCAQVNTMALQSGIDVLRAQQTQEMVDDVYACLKTALYRTSLSPDQIDELRKALAVEFRALSDQRHARVIDQR